MIVTLYSADEDVETAVRGLAQERATVQTRHEAHLPIFPGTELILVDAALPGMHNILGDYARVGRALRHNRPLIVVLSANPYIATVLRDYMIDAIAIKPVSPENVQAVLAGALARAQAAREP